MSSARAERRRLFVVVPGDLETRTGGYGYDRRMIDGLRRIAWDVHVVALDGSFPFPTERARVDAAAALASIPDRAAVLFDGLALGALPDEAAAHATRIAIVALVHHPLGHETGLSPAQAAALEDSERRALRSARHVVVTSRRTAAALAAYDVDADRLTVVEPGTDPAPLARAHDRESRDAGRQGEGDRFINLLCVATLTPRKGYEVLLDALDAVPFDQWRLRCAGSAERDAATTKRVRERLDRPRLAGRVTLVGDLDAATLADEYHAADVFVLATLYEGYGMAVAEALARGLPIVSTATGAIPDLVGAGAGIVVAPGDVGAFAAALARVLQDGELRRRLAAGARAVRNRLPTLPDSVRLLAEALVRTQEADGG